MNITNCCTSQAILDCRFRTRGGSETGFFTKSARSNASLRKKIRFLWGDAAGLSDLSVGSKDLGESATTIIYPMPGNCHP